MTPREMQCLRWELTELLRAEDDVLLIPLCPRCVQAIHSTHSRSKEPNWPSQPESHTIV
jgi:hypothetical protein